MKYINLAPGSKEWKEFRRSGIGASESSILLGINPWKDMYDLYDDKVSGFEDFINPSMQRGMDREQEAREWFEKEKNLCLMPKMVQHEIYPWKFATLDGIDLDESCIVEIKWSNKNVHGLAKKGIVIDYYMAQVQSQIDCCGIDLAYFLSCYGKQGKEEFVIVEVKRDDKLIKEIIEKEKHFYENHLLPKIPPK